MSQLLQNALYGSAMILTVAALRRLLKGRLAPEVWLVLWAVCLFRLLTPAAPESALSFYGVPGLLAERPAVSAIASAAASDGDAADVASSVTVNAPDAGSAGTETAAPAPVRPSLDWAAVLWGMWLLGAAVAGVRYGLLWLRTWRGVNGAILLPPDDPRYAPLPRRVRLRVAPIEGAPLTFGVVRPTVVLPPELNNGALACVLAHEGVHAKRRDNLWHYVMAAALTVFWWNPAVWLMAKLLRRDVELSCDRAALKKLGPERRAEYARVLLNLSTQAGGPAFCQTFGPKEAEERILFVVKYKKMSICSIILALALVCCVSVGFASSPVSAGPADDPAAPEPGSSIWITDDSGRIVASWPSLSNVRAPFDESSRVSPEDISLEEIVEYLNSQVAEGKLTREQADQTLADVQELLEQGKRGAVELYFSESAESERVSAPVPEAESAAPVTPTAPAAPAASSAAPAANYTWQQMTITSTPHHDETHHEETHNSETHHSGGHHH